MRHYHTFLSISLQPTSPYHPSAITASLTTTPPPPHCNCSHHHKLYHCHHHSYHPYKLHQCHRCNCPTITGFNATTVTAPHPSFIYATATSAPPSEASMPPLRLPHLYRFHQCHHHNPPTTITSFIDATTATVPPSQASSMPPQLPKPVTCPSSLCESNGNRCCL